MIDLHKLPTRVRHVLEDPGAQAVARVYAESFLDAATSHDVNASLEEFESFLDDVLAAHPGFHDVLLSGVVSKDEKIGMINRVVAPRASELFTNFLRVLARHDRLELLPAIFTESRTLNERRTGRRRVQVSTAKPLSSEDEQKIRNRLNESLPFDPILETKVKPELLGGLVIQVGDTVYDSSLRTRLKQLKDRLGRRSIHEIQSGRDRFSHSERD